MEFKGTSLLGGEKIGISLTDKPVTAWGGMALIAGGNVLEKDDPKARDRDRTLSVRNADGHR